MNQLTTSVALNPTQQRIMHFDSLGLKAGQIASIVGVSDGYISQLRKEEGYVLALAEYNANRNKEEEAASAEDVAKRAEREAEELTTAKYSSLENKLLGKIEENLPYAEFPMLVNALKAISDRQERRQQRLDNKKAITALQQNNNVQNITMLVLPGHAVQPAAPSYEVNTAGQIVAIDGKTISPLGSAGVKQLFSSLNNAAAPQPSKEVSNRVVEEAVGGEVLHPAPAPLSPAIPAVLEPGDDF